MSKLMRNTPLQNLNSVEPLRVDEKELDSAFSGYQRLWRDKPFTGVALELYSDKKRVYGEQQYQDGIEHGFAREWHAYQTNSNTRLFTTRDAWMAVCVSGISTVS